MTPLNHEQKHNIVERIQFIQLELEDFLNYSHLDWQTYQQNRDTRRNVERMIENIANASIDICKIILAGESVTIPSTYQEIILKLSEIGMMSDELTKKLALIAKSRNVLAHQYLDLRWDLIKTLLKEIPQTIPKFINAVKL